MPEHWSPEQAASVREIEHVWIPLSDGARLSARIWLPKDAETQPVPAILEYIPYRKDDATASADASRHPYFAANGYAGVRVDIRGTGDSEGICLDEYLKQEHDDALEVLAWLAEQPWCTGACGMIGYSWGGFNGLQIAARRPPQLKAVITGYSTDDRYTDDCHYEGGCLLASDMLKWASWMHALNSRPPDPRIVGDGWRAEWLERLRQTPPYIEHWMAHPTRDEFWKHGSVDEDYSAIEAAVLAFGGLADPYRNAVPRLLEHLSCPKAAIIGPWGHVFPSHGVPGPEIGFLQECVRWFDRWLKGIENGMENEPMLRVYAQDSLLPSRDHTERPGVWISEQAWPPSSVSPHEFALGADARMVSRSEGPMTGDLTVRGDQTCGAQSGAWCPNGLPAEMPDDQRPDDALSLVFDSDPLAEPLVLLGRPEARLSLSVDRPLALVSVRLCDIAPSGASTLVSAGLLNLAHREGHEHPAALVPGGTYQITVALNLTSQRIAAGHTLRLSVSPTYWPQAWPSPEAVALTVHTGGASTLVLPIRSAQPHDATPPLFGPAVESGPLRGTIASVADRARAVRRDEGDGVLVTEDRTTVAESISATSTEYRETALDRWTIEPDDPLSAAVDCEREITIERGEWRVRIVTTARQTCDATHVHTRSGIDAYEGDELVFTDRRTHAAPRHLY
ncbi:MAG: CocE/NonD family hydrolase [Coriobacteriia bacterium]|nr:CocE/NonD family hydrolase [Coriobacteriia bacterium]